MHGHKGTAIIYCHAPADVWCSPPEKWVRFWSALVTLRCLEPGLIRQPMLVKCRFNGQPGENAHVKCQMGEKQFLAVTMSILQLDISAMDISHLHLSNWVIVDIYHCASYSDGCCSVCCQVRICPFSGRRTQYNSAKTIVCAALEGAPGRVRVQCWNSSGSRPFLVGGLNPSEKSWSVGMMIPNVRENKKCSKPPTSFKGNGCWCEPVLYKYAIVRAYMYIYIWTCVV